MTYTYTMYMLLGQKLSRAVRLRKGKGKGHPRIGHEDPEGEWRYSSMVSLTSALDGDVDGQHHAPAALTPGNRPATHCAGDWVGPRAGLDGCGKSRPAPGFDPRTVEPVASRHTDRAVPLRDKIQYVHSCQQKSIGPKFPNRK